MEQHNNKEVRCPACHKGFLCKEVTDVVGVIEYKCYYCKSFIEYNHSTKEAKIIQLGGKNK